MSDLAGQSRPGLGRHPLDGLPPSAPGVAPAAAFGRFVLRGRPAALTALEAVLGFALPREACRAASGQGLHALWLGPDEWLILTETDSDGAFDALDTAMGDHPHSLVDVTHRQTALSVSGPLAESLLCCACPLDLDLSAFPVGMCTRTVLAKAEVVLWRRAADSFHLEVWRSFSPYVWGLLAEAAQGLD